MQALVENIERRRQSRCLPTTHKYVAQTLACEWIQRCEVACVHRGNMSVCGVYSKSMWSVEIVWLIEGEKPRKPITVMLGILDHNLPRPCVYSGRRSLVEAGQFQSGHYVSVFRRIPCYECLETQQPRRAEMRQDIIKVEFTLCTEEKHFFPQWARSYSASKTDLFYSARHRFSRFVRG